MPGESLSARRARVPTVVLLTGDRLVGEQIERRTRPTALRRVGGISLIERALLTWQRAGFVRFRVVVENDRDLITEHVRSSPRLRALIVELRTHNPSPPSAVGSVASFLGDDEDVLLARVEDVVTPDVARRFADALSEDPSQACLATDSTTEITRSSIASLGVRDHVVVATDDHVDDTTLHQAVGPIYLPRTALPTLRGMSRHASWTDLITEIGERCRLHAVDVAPGIWYPVHDRESLHSVNRILRRSLIKPSDGLVSRYLNRHVSLQITRLLIPLGITPNAMTTLVLLANLATFPLAASPRYVDMLIAGLIYQFLAILDGCDGEIARLSLRDTEQGASYDSIADNIGATTFFLAVGIGSWRASGNPIYLWGVGAFALMCTYVLVTIRRYITTHGAGAALAIGSRLNPRMDDAPVAFERLALSLVVFKMDMFWVIASSLMILGLNYVAFWWGPVRMLILAFMVTRSTHRGTL